MTEHEHHDLDYFVRAADKLAAVIFTAVRELGELMLDARKDLPAEQYFEFEDHLLRIWGRSHLQAALAVAKGKLHQDLFPAGAAHSKVLNLPETDQRRLLSNESFDVWTDDGSKASKTWREMTKDERDRLLGPKGGRIRTLDQQTQPDRHGSISETQYSKGRFEDATLRLSGGNRKRGAIQAGVLKATMPPDELAAFIKALGE